MIPRLSKERLQALAKYHPETGPAWAAAFPDLIAECAERWQLTWRGMASEGWPTNAVLFAEDPEGREVVLKLGHPDPENLTSIIALAAFDGRGTVRVLEADRERQIVLMERLSPGVSLRAMEATGNVPGDPYVLFSLLPRVGWTPPEPQSRLPMFRDWLARARGDYLAKPSADAGFVAYLDMAVQCLSELERQYPGAALLHGDLHHENILWDDRRGWLAVDPKGVIGPPVLECGRFIQNFLEDRIGPLAEAADRAVAGVLAERIGRFSDVLMVPPEDVARAAYIDVVVSNCWTLLDDDPADDGLTIIRSLHATVADSP